MELQLAPDDERTVFLDAIEESLRPLMRAVFEYGVSYQDLIGVVRALYIFALREHYDAQGRTANEMRLSVMTGITRGEVVKLFASRTERDEQRALAARRTDQVSKLLGKWHDDPRFSTPYGAPLDLSLRPEGTFRTFEQLLAAADTELDSETAIGALVTNRCAEVHAGKFIRCTTRAFLPVGKDLSKISRLGRLGSALHSTFAHNLFKSPAEPSYFDRTMVSDFPLTESGRSAMLSQLREEGEEFIDGMDRWVSTKATGFKDDANGRRYGVTALFFEDITKDDLGRAHIRVPLKESTFSD